jgi:aldose 1-epimerase
MTTPTAVAVRDVFGTLPDGRDVDRWTLTDETGTSAAVLTYGAIVQSLTVPDAHGQPANVALGFSALADYLERSPYFGCVAGRYANRIAGGRFELAGTTYQLPLNDPGRPNTLHGGPGGFHQRLWDARPVTVANGAGVELSLVSEDGDEGFPGRLDATVRYSLSGGALRIDYEAITDAPTVVNLTNHSYFNLTGEGAGTIEDHVLTLAASRYLPVDARLIPADPAPVAGTPFDFEAGTALGARLDDPHDQLKLANGYDHCFVFDEAGLASGPAGADEPRLVGTLADPKSGRAMDLLTTEPGIQLYTANTLSAELVGPSGGSYGPRAGVALETQHFPDSPNRPDFPSTVLLPGEVYRSTTILRFRH